MKKILFYTAISIFLVGGLGIMIYNCIYEKDDPTPDQTEQVAGNTTVENLVKEDYKYFDNMAGTIILYECQVVLNKPFNEGDKLVAVEVTNVFQQNLENTANVYEFKHVINYGDTDVKVLKDTRWFEDCPVVTDSLKLTFDQAYERAKQSDLIPSKSRFITLRRPLGPKLCNAQYIIGNENKGLMFVDGQTGGVSSTNPAFNQ